MERPRMEKRSIMGVSLSRVYIGFFFLLFRVPLSSVGLGQTGLGTGQRCEAPGPRS